MFNSKPSWEDRKEYADVAVGDFDSITRTHGYCMLKYDGIWCRLVIDGVQGTAKYYSRTGQLKLNRALTSTESSEFGPFTTILVGEFMFGQEWAMDPKRAGLFFAFDILVHKDVDVSCLTFKARTQLRLRCLPLEDTTFRNLQVFSSTMARRLWADYVCELGYEGLVFINAKGDYETDELARMKQKFEVDCFVVGYEEGEGKHKGRLGACLVRTSLDSTTFKVGGGYDDALRTEIWNNQKNYIGKCMTVTALKKFASGALRSPNFYRWHQEK